MLQVFESHAEILGYDTFTLCSLPYLKQIAEKVKDKLGNDAVPMVRTLKLGYSWQWWESVRSTLFPGCLRGLIKGKALHKSTGCEQDFATWCDNLEESAC